MVGGGRGSQIGYIHRSAALRDFTLNLWQEPLTSMSGDGLRKYTPCGPGPMLSGL